MSSIAVSPFTMPAALAAADDIIDGIGWTADPNNPDQVAWMETFRRRADVALGLPEVHRNATHSAADHVAWLKAEGWDAQIQQGSPNDLFLASTINIVAKWEEAGQSYKDRDGVDRVLLKKGAKVARRSGVYPVVKVATQHPDYVFMFQQLSCAPINGHALLSIATDAYLCPSFYDEVHLDFPQVDLNIKTDARYMIGLRSGHNVVTQAAEQLKLEMNEIGGRAIAAAEVAVTRGMSTGPETVYIEGPFMVAVVRLTAGSYGDSLAFAAYVDKDAWKRPADGRI